MSTVQAKQVQAYWDAMTPEQRAAESAKRAKKRIATMKRNRRERGKRVKTTIPISAIPRPVRRAKKKKDAHPVVAHMNGNGKQRALADKVHAEYDINTDSMTLVLGKLRLPFRVKV